MATLRYVDGDIWYQQHNISGTGVFNGTPVGYAMYTYAAGGASFRVRYPDQGTDGNAFTFSMIAPTNAEVTKTYAQVDMKAKACRVFLKGTPGAITATAAEVVAAINNPVGQVIGQNFARLGAGLITGAVIPAGLAPVNLSGGLDPDLSVSYSSPRFTAPANANGGLFTFGQARPWRLLGVGGELNANGKVTIQVVNVDAGLGLTTDIGVVLSEQTLNVVPRHLMSVNYNFPIRLGQAVKISTDNPATGTMFVYGIASDVTGT